MNDDGKKDLSLPVRLVFAVVIIAGLFGAWRFFGKHSPLAEAMDCPSGLLDAEVLQGTPGVSFAAWKTRATCLGEEAYFLCEQPNHFNGWCAPITAEEANEPFPEMPAGMF